MVKIEHIEARKILDSRGQWTIEAQIFSDNDLAVKVGVPQGKSRGSGEAVYLEVEKAVNNINSKIRETLKGFSLEDQLAIDNKLKELDNSEDKSNLGANAILASSLASAKLAAKTKNKPLWLYLSELAKVKPAAPKLLANLINGGLHAQSGLVFQEYILIPETSDMEKAIDLICRSYERLGHLLQSNSWGTAIGDEGGYVLSSDEDDHPFKLMEEILSQEENLFSFGIDAAADNIDKYSPEELLIIYKKIVASFPLSYLEDPFSEKDFKSWRQIFSQLAEKINIVGDDLTVTNPQIISKPEMKEMANGVIIKPNQIGTLSETLLAIATARENNWQVYVSHRSGETNDDFIADLAFAVAADGFKLGAPARGERISKYNRLLEINEEYKNI